MPAPLADVTQTQTSLTQGRQAERGLHLPPPPPQEAIMESIAAAKMRSVAPLAANDSDLVVSRFAPWTAPPRTGTTGVGCEPPVFVVAIDDAKLDELRTAFATLAGRAKTPGRDASDLALLLGALGPNAAQFGAGRLRPAASSALTFGQRATRGVAKSHEAGSCVLRLPAADASRDIELRISLKHFPAQSGKTGSFLQVAGSAPLGSGADVKLVDQLRCRLTSVWGKP